MDLNKTMEATYNKTDIRISPDHLKTTQDLIVLRRGDEAIILDGILLRPLHIRRGANMVLDVATLQTDIKKHPALVNLLIDYGILKKRGEVTIGYPALPDFSFDKWQQLSLYLLLTHACNLSCVYCFNGDITYKKQRPPSMTKKIAEASIRWALKHLSPQGKLEIVFFGGEPLLKWPLIKWIINLCETKLKLERLDAHINYHLTSNLTILPKDLPSIATQIGMSFLCNVDGPKQIHDILRPRVSGYSSYNATVKTIRHLQSAGHNIALRSTITSQNVFRLSETVAHHAELGGKSSALVPLNPVSSDQIPLHKNLMANPKDLAYELNIAYESGIYPPEFLHPFSEAVERVNACQPRRIACGAPTGCTPVVDAMGDNILVYIL